MSNRLRKTGQCCMSHLRDVTWVWLWTTTETCTSTSAELTEALLALTYSTPATSCLTCVDIAQRYCVHRVTCSKYYISITSPSSSSLSSSCKVPWWCTPTADDQWRFLVLLTYSCQTLIPLCLENAWKTFPAWPAARNFMLIISAFPIPPPSFVSEIEYWFPQDFHIISESRFTCNFTHISIAIDWVFFFFSKNTKTKW